ncbi:MAG TPA: hypothetical protein VN772_01855 [Solirubrobacteraceae bacterium]|nr:hypothetical protein [Solirubrobacteraceae bacterium]
MVPLALSGTVVISVVVLGAVLLLLWLLRSEARDAEAEERTEAAQRTATTQRSD